MAERFFSDYDNEKLKEAVDDYRSIYVGQDLDWFLISEFLSSEHGIYKSCEELRFHYAFLKRSGQLETEVNLEEESEETDEVLGCIVPSYITRSLSLFAPYVSWKMFVTSEMYEYLVPRKARKKLPQLRYGAIVAGFGKKLKTKIPNVTNVEEALEPIPNQEIMRQMAILKKKFGESFNVEQLQKFEREAAGGKETQERDTLSRDLSGPLNPEMIAAILDEDDCEEACTSAGKKKKNDSNGSHQKSTISKQRSDSDLGLEVDDFTEMRIADDARGNDSPMNNQEGTTVKRTRIHPPKAHGDDFSICDIIEPDQLPRGYGLLCKGRHLQNLEWRAVLQYAFRKKIELPELDATQWKELTRRVGITSELSGEQIMAQFYSFVVPNLAELETHGQKISIGLSKMDKFTFMSVFHGIENVGYKDMVQLINDMKLNGALGSQIDSRLILKEFVKYMLTCGLEDAKDALNTLPSDLENVQETIRNELLDNMEMMHTKSKN